MYHCFLQHFSWGSFNGVIKVTSRTNWELRRGVTAAMQIHSQSLESVVCRRHFKAQTHPWVNDLPLVCHIFLIYDSWFRRVTEAGDNKSWRSFYFHFLCLIFIFPPTFYNVWSPVYCFNCQGYEGYSLWLPIRRTGGSQLLPALIYCSWRTVYIGKKKLKHG